MPGEPQNGMRCGEFEALLADALDGALSGHVRARFEAHRNACGACTSLFGETQAGLNWLQALPEVEPPADLVNRIMLATTGARQSWMERLRPVLQPKVQPLWAAVAQPRFAMSFAMAFFSITMMLSITGFKLSSLKRVDLRPSAIARTYNETTGRIMHYYENIRFVYELETRVRDLKRATTPENQPADQQKPKENNKGVDREPGKYQNYSRDEALPVLARHSEGGREQAALAGRTS